MAKAYHCPACQNEVERGATVCSNPACRKDLAYCSYCRDISTYTLVERAAGRIGRDRYKCERCEHVGMKCLAWAAGGYCNGLTRTDGKFAQPLCANCNTSLGDLGRNVVGWTLIGALGGLVRRRP